MSPDSVEVVVTRKRGRPHEGWMWEPMVGDFERAMTRAGMDRVGDGAPNGLYDFLGRFLGRSRAVIPRSRGNRIRVLAMMGPKPRLAFPDATSHRYRLILYVWDCWPSEEKRWREVFGLLRPSGVAFSAEAAADYWRARLPSTEVCWLPEAIDPSVYSKGCDLASRPVDVLEMGRSHGTFHAAVTDPLRSEGVVHQFQTPGGPPQFSDRSDLARGISNSKTVVCYPASVTDPNGRSWGMETMTYRYLEAIASRALIVGKIPLEMIKLFGFVPGVNISAGSEVTDLLAVLRHPDSYQGLVDRSYERLGEIGTWDARARSILELAGNVAKRS